MKTLIGTEIEFGIAAPQAPDLSPIITSTHAVLSYANYGTPWDYAGESPLRDSRGFDLRRYHTAPIVDPQAVGQANMVLENGGRFYVDHAHPEYSAPECSNAYLATLYELAGSIIMHRATEEVNKLREAGLSAVSGHKPCPPLNIYKNNVDGKGASYGAHENYLYPRTVPFATMASALIPFFVARQVIIGAGRVGIGQASEQPGFQISQRADYIEQAISLETTLNRGIINTRDEPHMDADQWGRLHVIVGDANMSHTSIFLKLGMTDLVIRTLIENPSAFGSIELEDPVSAMHTISHDPSLQARVALVDGRSLTALDILAEYRQIIGAHMAAQAGVEQLNLDEYAFGQPRNCFSHADPYAASQEDVDLSVLAQWDEVQELLAENPLKAAHLLDWVAKYALMQGYIAKGKTWQDPTMALVDLQYTDINPARSLYHHLERSGRMRALCRDCERFVDKPPQDTRAWLRGTLVRLMRPYVRSVNWDRVTLAVPDTEGYVDPSELVTIRMDQPQGFGSSVELMNTLTEILGLATNHELLFEQAMAITQHNYEAAYGSDAARAQVTEQGSAMPRTLRSRSELSNSDYSTMKLLFHKLTGK
ncbi:MAG: depupylase/deamidase Dop [Corynebacterium sp.]|nr:depupylase/deamidase Dop [Corynebacterium sp.]